MMGQWDGFLKATLQPILVLDTGFTVVAANRRSQEIAGVGENELIGRKCYEIMHGTNEPARGCPMHSLLTRRSLETVEMEVETIHGTFLISCAPIVDASGVPLGVVHVATDITEKKRAEEELKEREVKYRYLFENSPAGMFRSSLADGRIVDANHTLSQMFGIDNSGDLHAADFYADPKDRRQLLKAIKREKRIDRHEVLMARRDGSMFWALISARLDSRGHYIEGVVTDITAQKEAQEALRESEERYRVAIENCNDCVVIFRDGVYVYVNQKYVEAVGVRDAGEMLGTAIGRFIHPDDYGRIESYRRDRKAGKEVPTRYELRIIDVKGRVVFFEAAVSVITLKGELATLVFMRDITKRMEVQKELEEQVKLLQTFIDTMPNPIFIRDPDGRFIQCNRAFEEYYGVSRQTIRGKTVFDIEPAKEARVHAGKDGELIKEGGVLEYDAVVTDPSGRVHDVIIRKAAFLKPDGTLGGIVGVVIDITDLKRAGEMLKESEAKYRSVAEESLAGFYIIQDGLFRYVNRRFCEITGYRYDEIVDRMEPLDLVYGEDRDVVEENLRKRFGGETGSIQYRFRMMRKSGLVARVEALGSSFDYRGRPAAIGTLLDITKETILEEQLQQAQKMEAVGQLAGGMAHDFNNILTTIMGYCGLLQAELDEDDPHQLYVEEISMASEKGAQLTSGLLAFGRKQVMEMKPQKLGELIKGVQRLLERLLPEDVRLEIRLPRDDCTVLADSTQIYQLLMNLITNSRDAMPGGGTLLISADTLSIDENFIATKGFGEAGDYAVLCVVDTGCGIDPRVQEKMFEPFFTTKEPGKGTGLGLSIVYGIVKQHGGFIDVRSVPGAGTTFTVYIPIAKGKAARRRSSTQGTRGGTETILIAEDNRSVRELIREILRKAGYHVVEAVDGEEAIGRFAESSQVIDLSILDVVMPKRNGKQVYDEIVMIRPDARVLFVSGYAADVITDKGIRDQSLEYIPKPVSPTLLLKKVRELLDRK
jgi:PAS domain S-box-containing protein